MTPNHMQRINWHCDRYLILEQSQTGFHHFHWRVFSNCRWFFFFI